MPELAEGDSVALEHKQMSRPTPLPDYYAILGLPVSATAEQVKRAYYNLARRYHPDLHGQTQNERIKLINEAYSILSDLTQRAAYDTLLRRQQQAQQLTALLQRQQRAAQRTPEISWGEGVVGFVRELKKGLREEP